MDIPNQLVYIAITLGVGGCALMYYAAADRKPKSLKYWIVSQYLMALGCLSLSSQHFAFHTKVAWGSTLLLSASIASTAGVIEFTRKRKFSLWIIAPFLLFNFAIHHFDLLPAATIITLNLIALAALCFFSAELLIKETPDFNRSAKALGYMARLLSVIILVAAIDLAVRDLSTFLAPSISASALLSAVLICSIVFSMGYMMTIEEFATEQIERQANQDALTGIYNRRAFYLLSQPIVARCHREGEWISLMVLDIDYFKRINDLLGHAAGDRILQLFSSGMQKSIRDSDVFARFGGEEFVLLMPNQNYDRSKITAERLRRAFVKIIDEQQEIDIDSATVSIGFVSTKDQRFTLDQLISLADKNLYLAKQYGRNQSVGCEALHENAAIQTSTPKGLASSNG